MNDPRDSVRAYVRGLEETVSRLAGRPVILSQRDWHLATKWFEWGVPLEVVLGALEARRGRGVRNLACVAKEVESTWRAVAAGRSTRAEESKGSQTDRDRVAERWRRARDDAPVGSELRALLDEVVALAEAGPRDAASVDRRVDAALPDVAPAEILEAAIRESEENLAGFRSRMSPEAFESTLRRAVVTRIRRALGLPRWSSTPRHAAADRRL